MKKTLTILLTLMLLFTSLLSHNVAVYADEETGEGEETTTETGEVSGDEDDDPEVIVGEEDPAEDPGDPDEDGEDQINDEEDPGIPEEGDPTDVEPGEEEPGEEVPEEEEENDPETNEVTEGIDSDRAVNENGMTIEYRSTDDDGLTGLIFTWRQDGEIVPIPWAAAFMADPNATITLEGREDFIFSSPLCEIKLDQLRIIPKWIKGSNVTAENFIVHVSTIEDTYTVDLRNANVNKLGNKDYSKSWKWRVDKLGDASVRLILGQMISEDVLGDEDPWLKQFRNYSVRKENYNEWYGATDTFGGIYPGSHLDIYDTHGNYLTSYYFIGKTAKQDIYFDDVYFLSHSHGIEIDLRALIDDKVPGGNLVFKVCTYNYTAYTETVNIENLVKNNSQTNTTYLKKLSKLCQNAPTDITYESSPNGDLIIRSEDKTFLKALAVPRCTYKSPANDSYTILPAKTSYIGGGLIGFDDATIQNQAKLKDITTASATKTITDQQYKYIDNQNDPAYGDYYQCVVIPSDFFIDNGFFDGHHTIVLSAEGYLPTEPDYRYFDLKNEPKEVDPADVVLSLDEEGNLLIKCTDAEQEEDFYEKLMMPVRDDKVHTGGRIQINSDKYLYNQKNSNVIIKTGGRLMIASQTLKDLFGGDLSGVTNFKITARGYNTVEKDQELPYIITLGTEPAKLYFLVSKTYAVDTSNDVTWSIKKRVQDTFVELTEDDDFGFTPNGNHVALLAEQFGTYKLIAVTATGSGDVTDELVIDVTAEGLKVTAAKSKDDAVVGQTKTMVASAAIGTDDVSDYLSYRSSNEAIATVDSGGAVRFLSMGSVDITAYIADQAASTTYSVYMYDKTAELTTTFVNINNPEDVYKSGMEIGEKYQIHVFAGETEVAPEFLAFKSSAAAIASIDANGIVEAKKLGTAKITATVNDFKQRSVSKSVKVINKVFYSLVLNPVGYTPWLEYDEDVLFFDAKDLPDDPITLKAIGTDINHNEFETTAVKYASSDPNIVSVSSSGVVTIKKAGEATVTATVTTNPKDVVTKGTLVFRIFDFTPKLSTNKITLNKYHDGAVMFNVSPAYLDYYDVFPDQVSTITGVRISGTDYAVTYDESNDEVWLEIADPTEEKIKALKTGKYVLSVDMENGKTYDFDFTVNVTAKKPNLTLKTSGTFNTFTGENSLSLKYSSKDAAIADVTPLNGWCGYDEGDITLKKNADGKFVTSGTMRFTFHGYSDFGYVDKKVTFKTVATKPSVKLAQPSVKLYVPADSLAKSKTVDIKVVKKGGVSGTLKWGEDVIPLDEEGNGTVLITDVKSQKITFTYEEAGWSGKISLPLTVTVNSVVPVGKLSSASLTLNTRYKTDGSVRITTNIKTEPITGVTVNSGSDKLNVSYDDNGKILVSLKEGTGKGTYKVNLTPQIAGDVELKPLTLTVNVTDSDPKITLSAGAVRLNSKFADQGSTKIKNASKLAYGVTVTGIGSITAPSDDVADIGFDAETNSFTFKLKASAKGKKGSHIYYIYPRFSNGQVSSTGVKVNVVLYNAKATATVSLSGSLNQLDSAAVVLGTVKTKLLNKKIIGIDYSSELLDIALNENGKLEFSLKETENVIKDQTVKQSITYLFEDGDSITGTANVKIARKAPKVKASRTEVVAYNTTNRYQLIDTVELYRSAPEGAQIRKVTFIPDDSKAYDLRYDSVDEVINVIMGDASKVKVGSKTVFTVKIDWVGDYGVYGDGTKGLKTTTLKITVKNISGTITSK